VAREQFVAQEIPPPPLDPLRGFHAYPAQTQIAVMDGDPPSLPTWYAGSVRVRALPPSAAGFFLRGPGEAVILLEVSAEPRLERFSVDGNPALRKVVDDQGQGLVVVPQDAPTSQQTPWAGAVDARGAPAGPRQVPIRLKLGQKTAKSAKQLEGTLTC